MDLEWVLGSMSLSEKREGNLRHRHRRDTGKRPHEDEGRDWSYTQPPAKEQHQEPPEIRRGAKDSPLELLVEAWLCQHFDLRLLGFKSVRSVVLSLHIGGSLLQQPEETDITCRC